MPVVHIPAFAGDHGMPVGISVVAGRFCDQHLLMISKVLGEPLMAEGGWNLEPVYSVLSTMKLGPSFDMNSSL